MSTMNDRHANQGVFAQSEAVAVVERHIFSVLDALQGPWIHWMYSQRLVLLRIQRRRSREKCSFSKKPTPAACRLPHVASYALPEARELLWGSLKYAERRQISEDGNTRHPGNAAGSRGCAGERAGLPGACAGADSLSSRMHSPHAPISKDASAPSCAPNERLLNYPPTFPPLPHYTPLILCKPSALLFQGPPAWQASAAFRQACRFRFASTGAQGHMARLCLGPAAWGDGPGWSFPKCLGVALRGTSWILYSSLELELGGACLSPCSVEFPISLPQNAQHFQKSGGMEENIPLLKDF